MGSADFPCWKKWPAARGGDPACVGETSALPRPTPASALLALSLPNGVAPRCDGVTIADPRPALGVPAPGALGTSAYHCPSFSFCITGRPRPFPGSFPPLCARQGSEGPGRGARPRAGAHGSEAPEESARVASAGAFAGAAMAHGSMPSCHGSPVPLWDPVAPTADGEFRAGSFVSGARARSGALANQGSACCKGSAIAP
mmetsp:Transcript_119507/g.334728  ORF Transcript_119507/g.334728 Transcript_119507/m.334728 type:complete len:200 (-) Transcript_119507:109-708(-)